MYAMVVEVDIKPGRNDEAEEGLKSGVIPQAKASEGFVKGYWIESADGGSGMGMVIYDSEEAAKKASATVQVPEEAPLSVRRVEVCRVTGEA
jgi:hypothetical protein